MKKIFSKIFILMFLFTLMFSSMSFADSGLNDTVTPLEAKKASIFQIVMDMKANEKSPWQNKTVKILEPVEVYDASDSLYSYLFNLTVDGKVAGFIEVSALRDEYPILSYAYEGSAMDLSEVSELKQKSKTKTPTREKVVALGPAYFGLKQDFSDDSADIISSLGTVSFSKEQNKPKIKRNIDKNTDARELRKSIDAVVDISGVDPSKGVYDNLDFETGVESFKVIGGVADMNQIYSSLWTGPSGCAPTSAANIMKYWASHGYAQLTQGLSDEQLLYNIRTAMGTRSDGSTPLNNISPGMKTFALNRGVSTAKAWYLPGVPPSWSSYKSAINTYGPNVISFSPHAFYNEHSVTGVGWTEFTYNGSSIGHQYMEVHDNNPNTPFSVFVAYGRMYGTNLAGNDGIYFDQFSPK